ncbi:MAG: hypothetical protein AAFY26_24805, partial [Cyanobacteria bacterium J06638_22]
VGAMVKQSTNLCKRSTQYLKVRQIKRDNYISRKGETFAIFDLTALKIFSTQGFSNGFRPDGVQTVASLPNGASPPSLFIPNIG